jgi:hypothetical protein
MKTNVRETSLAAHDDLQAHGKLELRERQIVKFMEDERSLNPDFTRLEISHYAEIPVNSVAGRVNSLIKKKVLFELPRRKCHISGRMVYPVALVPKQLNLIGEKNV